MASDQPVPRKQDPPLSFMQVLSPTVAYYEPTASTGGPRGTGAGADPELIIILSWMGAQDVHIAKYIAEHRTLFPRSRILLVRSPLSHSIWPPLSTAGIRLAATTVKSVAPAQNEGPEDPPRVLIHVFSNGGTAAAAKLYRMLLAEASVPRHVALFDSCPGYYHYMRTYRAATSTLPWFLKPLMHVLIISIVSVTFCLRMPLPPDANAEAVNSTELVRHQTRRAYMYGTGDDVIASRDVEDHAAKASRNGFVVRSEKFEGGKHVSHVRVDADRYWRTVKETWEGKRVDDI